MNVQDININDDFDLDTSNGDFNITDSDPNHIRLIVKTYLGNWKESPLTGFGIDKYIASSGTEELIKRNLGVQLKADNYKVEEIKIENGLSNNIEYFINAERIK